MMIPRQVTALIVGLALALPAVASAHEGHGKKVMGTVTMTAADHVMVKTADGKEQTIALNAQTKVVKGKTAVAVEGLKPGTRVVVTLTPKEPPTAAQIQIGAETTSGAAAKK